MDGETQKGWSFKVGNTTTNVKSADWKGLAVGTGNNVAEEFVPAEPAAASSGSGALPWIIAGVVVVLGGVGGFCIYKKKKDAANKDVKEGGSKALFKTQIKKNVAHKESLV